MKTRLGVIDENSQEIKPPQPILEKASFSKAQRTPEHMAMSSGQIERACAEAKKIEARMRENIAKGRQDVASIPSEPNKEVGFFQFFTASITRLFGSVSASLLTIESEAIPKARPFESSKVDASVLTLT